MQVRNLSLSFGSTVIYDNAEFNLNPRDKVGVVGVNGAGKSTLFNILLEKIKPDAGYIDKSDTKNIGYLPQIIEIDTPDITVWDFLVQGRPINELNNQLVMLYSDLANNPDDENIAEKISYIQDRLEYYNCYTAENELLEIIENMNIDDKLLDMKLSNLSGGQKSKVAFARMLYSVCETLLLDEPTNHLDMETRDWVASYLKKYRGCVLIISHDKDFLNQIVGKILYIDKVQHKITVFDGNYDDYKRNIAELKRAREQKIASEEFQIKKLSEFVQRAKEASPTNHTFKRMGKTREKILEKLIQHRTLRIQEYKKINMNLSPMRAAARFPISVDNLWFRYPGAKLLYRNLSFYIDRGERFLIVGANGVGKSTLLKLIIGQLIPERGQININPKTDIAYYAQELEQLDINKTVMENVLHPEFSDTQLRSVLANFLFFGTDVAKQVSVLSPGERARVALCKMLLKRANLLILDEPTNHLDPETQGLIGDNFHDYDGTIIMVSHNPDFVEQIGITRMLVLPDGRITDYSHDALEYFYNINSGE